MSTPFDMPLPTGQSTVATRQTFLTGGLSAGEAPTLPYGFPDPALLPQPGFNLAGVFSTFWSGYVFGQYSETVTYLPVVTAETPGATPTAGYDSRRAQPVSYTDGSFGVGFQAIDPTTGVLRKGYLSGQTLPVALNEAPITQRRDPAGKIVFSRPVLYWLPPTVLQKGDLIVRADGRRYVVADAVTPGQAWGSTLVFFAELEARSSRDIVYQVPL